VLNRAIVGVRQTVTHSRGMITSGEPDTITSITFSTTVRPTRPDLAPSMVTFRFYRVDTGR
jgi:hypothetical protein